MYITLTDLQGGGGSPSTPNYLFLTKNVRIRLPDAIYEFSLSWKCQPDSGYTSSLKAYSMLDFQNYKKLVKTNGKYGPYSCFSRHV